MTLARMATAEEFYKSKTEGRGVSKRFTHLDYLEFAEDYADYVVSHEKFIDHTGLKNIEAIENKMKAHGFRSVGELAAFEESERVAQAV